MEITHELYYRHIKQYNFFNKIVLSVTFSNTTVQLWKKQTCKKSLYESRNI